MRTAMLNRFPRTDSLWTLAFVFLLGLPPAGAADTSQGEVPPVPPGYKTSQEAMKAVTTGKVKVVTPPAALPEGVTSEMNVEYGKVGERSLKLDLYRPKKMDKPAPAIIFIHGGGWTGGDRAIMTIYAVPFAAKGYVTCTISYRLAGEAKFPACVQDAKCAVRFLRANAEKYNIDPDRIAISGNSAGGHLSTMVGYSSDVKELEGGGGHPETSSRVQAVVNFYGPVDLTTDFAKGRKEPVNLIGKSFEEAPEIHLQASPIHYLTKDDPPTLIFQGTIDDIVPVDQGDMLSSKLKELGIPCVYDRIEGWPHTMDLVADIHKRCVYQMEKFLTKHLGGGK